MIPVQIAIFGYRDLHAINHEPIQSQTEPYCGEIDL
jgi:hypothetical protein